jgi:hypothetical protein
MPYDLSTNVMRLVGTRFLQHLPARITCGWSGEPVKYCRCIHCFPECIYCQALNDACHCVKDWRHPVTNPSAEEEELEYEQTWRKRKDVALLEWNLLPGYQVQEVRVPGCGQDEQGLPVYTPIYKPSYRTPHWRKVYVPGEYRSWNWVYVGLKEGTWAAGTAQEAREELQIRLKLHCDFLQCVEEAETLREGISELSFRPPVRFPEN